MPPFYPGGNKPRAHTLTKLVQTHFPEDPPHVAILYLGCGHGALIHFARREGYANIRGVDGSPEQVAAAKHLEIEGVEEGDILAVLATQADDSLDVVIAFDVIEHFTRDELLSFVDQVRRVLRSRGVLDHSYAERGIAVSGRMRYWDSHTSWLSLERPSASRPCVWFFQGPVLRRRADPARPEKRVLMGALESDPLLGCAFTLRSKPETVAGSAIFSQNFLVVAEKA